MAHGYDPSRFIDPIRPYYLCGICHCVLKDPRLCEAKEHYFCLSCITQYLAEGSQTCSECQKPLTLETLKRPQYVVPMILSKLRIKCDYSSRGCPEFAKLGKLEDHLSVCEYRPVLCDSCGQQLNAKDEDNHKKSFCQFRRANMQAIEDIKTSQDEMLNEIKTISARQKETRNDKRGINEEEDELHMEVKKIKKDVAVIKQTLKRLEQGRHATDNQNIFIIGGGYGCDKETIPLKSVELYNIAERSSKIVKEFEQPLVSSALCVHDNRILVSGGVGDEDNSDEIKVLNTKQHLPFAVLGKLPFKLFGHDVVVHEGNLYVIGGCIWHERKTLNEIYQISLTPPYAAELLTKMPEPRRHHRAAIVNKKLFILGGAPTGNSEDAISSVFVYDLIKKEFKPRPSLPRPVSRMSIVTWGGKIVAFGGMDKGGRAINDVIMYDTETGRSERLPAMIHKRFGSSAVITNDVIVVFGGWNREQGYLNSVESFTIGGDRWKELPGMKERRCWATAVVKRHISFQVS